MTTTFAAAILSVALAGQPSPPASLPATPPQAASSATLAHVEERGHGPVNMILIPGLASDWRVFDGFMTRNADRYRMFAVTLPGFGGSPPPPDYSARAEGRWLTSAEKAVVQLIEDRHLDKPVVLGHSLGGHLALRLAVHSPGLIRSAISLDGLPVFPVPPRGPGDNPQARAQSVARSVDRYKELSDEKWAESQRAGAAQLVRDPKRAAALGDMFAFVPRPTTIGYMTELMLSDIRPDLWRLTPPTLVIGAIDSDTLPNLQEFVRRGVTREFEHASASVQLIFFEGSRHFIMDDQPAALDRAVAEFLDGKRPSGLTVPASGPAADVVPAGVPVAPAPAGNK